jgi:predicted nucleic acid-binding protein
LTPSTAVVDASVAIKWMIAEPDSDRASRLLGVRLLAPEIFDAECTNVLWTKVRKQQISAEFARNGLSKLHAVPLIRVANRELAERALALAIELDHPAYDCLYLALSERERVPCVSADARFLRAVAKQPSHASHVRSLATIPLS